MIGLLGNGDWGLGDRGCGGCGLGDGRSGWGWV